MSMFFPKLRIYPNKQSETGYSQRWKQRDITLEGNNFSEGDDFEWSISLKLIQHLGQNDLTTLQGA